MPTARFRLGSTGATFVLAGLVLAVSQFACGDSDYSTPTAGPQPPPPTPVQPVITQALYSVAVTPNMGEAEDFPLTAELLLDGRILSAVVMGDPWAFAYGDPLSQSVHAYVDGALSAGDHTLALRFINQGGRLRLYLQWRVEVRWNTRGWVRVSGGANNVQLRAGEAWSLPFTVPAAPAP